MIFVYPTGKVFKAKLNSIPELGSPMNAIYKYSQGVIIDINMSTIGICYLDWRTPLLS
jgi:hypothetical protein